MKTGINYSLPFQSGDSGELSPQSKWNVCEAMA